MTALNHATALYHKRRYFDALMLTRQTLAAESAVNPETEISWLQLGIDSMLALDLPEQAEPFFMRQAKQLKVLGQVEAAMQCYRRAIAQCPDSAAIQLNAGIFFYHAQHLTEAEPCYREAIRLNPYSAVAYNNLANLLNDQDQREAAYTAYQQAIAINPLYAEAHSNLGNWHKDQKQYPEAETHYRRAIELKPDFTEALNNYAVFLQDCERHEEALPYLLQALTINENYAPVHLNLGGLMMNLLRHADAERHYRKALAIKPDYAEAAFNLGICLLMQGKMQEGWGYYEARFDSSRKIRMSIPPVYPFPRWQGESLANKTILVWQEQGIGDQIMFARYLKALKADTGAAKVVLVCHRALKSLLANVDGVDVVANDQDSIPWCDYWTFIMSLPFHLQATQASIPARTPYLSAASEQCDALQPLMQSITDLKVGLCWKGSAIYARDHLRSPGLAAFTPLLELEGVRFFTLLPDSRAEFNAWSGTAGVDLGHELDHDTVPFEETAALIQHLDLVITCDTSVAHLAGALAKPTWLVLAYAGEWRWLHHRSDTPWYPELRLFRQTQRGDWTGVFAQLTNELHGVIDDAVSL